MIASRLAGVILFLLSNLQLPGQSVELSTLATLEGIEFYWESGREVGLLIKDSKQIKFSLISQKLLIGHLFYKGEFYYQNQHLMVDAVTAALVKNYFKKDSGSTEPLVPVVKSNHRVAVILIDAGHGGKDPGSIGRHGSLVINEKDICLTIALDLERQLKSRYPDKKILMTRSDDRYLTLEQRVAIANNQELKSGEAELYISIHANAAFNKEARGYEVWRLPNSVTRPLFSSKALSSNTQEALNLLLNEEYLAESSQLASAILSAMDRELSTITLNRGQREQSWFVVKNAKMAAVLVEVGFVTNKEEAIMLNDPTYLKLITKALYNGLGDFIEYFEK